MKNRNICNMITSIITGSVIIPLLVLGIIYTNNTLSKILLCIYYPILIICYILKSIFYGMKESVGKEVLYRISNSVLDVATVLITVSFSLLLPNPYRWIVMGILCFIGVLEVLLDSIKKLVEGKFLLSAIKGILFISILIFLYPVNFIVELGLFSALLFYASNVLGKVLDNKIILSSEIIGIVLYGIFIIFL